jgi:hypothetical protein
MNDSGTGVEGTSSSGVGVLASSTQGVALQVTGKAVFSRSGLAVVPAGTNRVIVTGVALTSTSLILALVQQSAGSAFVRAAVPAPASSSLTILLNKSPSVNVTVAWFVVN